MASNIYISKEDYEAAKNYLIQFLRDSGFTGSLEDGTALHDVVIKAFALMYTLYKRETQKVSAYLSLDKAQEMQDLIGSDYDEAVDSILSNWFVQRKDGTKTTGTIRLWFSKPLEFFNVNPGTQFAVADGVGFEASSPQVYTESNFAGVMNTVNNLTEYYIEVQVISINNTSSNPAAGSYVSAYPNNIYYLRSEIINDFTPGIDKESTEDFIRRSSKAITTRELITERAIITVLTDQFPTIYNVFVAGYGAPEQLRDIIDFNGVVAHVGNKADLYVCSEFSYAESSGVVDVNGNIKTADFGSGAIVTHIESVSIIQDSVKTPTVFNYISCTETLYGSNHPDLIIGVPAASPGDNVVVRYLTCPVVTEAKDYVTNNENRVACYDPLVKCKYPVVTEFDLNVRAKLGADQATLTKGIKLAVNSYIKDITKNSTNYVESEMVAAIHAVSPAILAVTLPLTASYSVFDPKACAMLTGVLPSYLVAEDLNVTSAQFTDNTMQLYTDDNLISVSYI